MAIEFSVHPNAKTREMEEEVAKKVQAMSEMVRLSKVLCFKAESELKKEL